MRNEACVSFFPRAFLDLFRSVYLFLLNFHLDIHISLSNIVWAIDAQWT